MTGARDKCRGEFEDMRKQRLDEFMSGFSVITNKLKEMYQVGAHFLAALRVKGCLFEAH